LAAQRATVLGEGSSHGSLKKKKKEVCFAENTPMHSKSICRKGRLQKRRSTGQEVG